MIQRFIEGIIIGVISGFVLKGLDKYGGIEMIKSLFQTFVIEMWPIWFGLTIALLYWFIREVISIHKCITRSLNFDKKLDELGAERRELLTHVHNSYNGLAVRLDKIEKRLPPASNIN